MQTISLPELYNKSHILATKEDIANIQVEIEKMRTDMEKFPVEIEKSLRQWVLGTFIGVVILIPGLYAAVIFT
jgi:hypothetical protein